MKTKELLELTDILNELSRLGHNEKTLEKNDEIKNLILDEMKKKLE